MSTVFSMIQPSGKVGIGHYLGAVRHWKKAQDEGHDCLFAVADLHAITVPQDPSVLKTHVLDVMAFYLACGIDPEKSTLFVQSHVSAHAELGWVLGCITSLGELNRMTQFKDKSQNKKQERVGAGLFSYPSLMAADILLYQTELVPVGDDQKQHIELTRDLALRFNQKVDASVFTIPDPLISNIGSRIMALGDPYKKMSKSDQDANNYIALEDDAKRIQKKVMRAVTDSLNNIAYDPENQKGLSNLIELYAACTDMSIESVVSDFQGKGYGDFKKALALTLSEKVESIHQQFQLYRKKEKDLQDLMDMGAKVARERAFKTLDAAYKALGLRR